MNTRLVSKGVQEIQKEIYKASFKLNERSQVV